MRNVQIILNAILSKDIFEYILVDKAFTILQFSSGITKYLDETPSEGEDVLHYLPELVGSEEEIKKIFIKKYCLYTLESVYKNGYYVNISIEYCDQDTAIILLHNITAITTTRQRLLQYSNESTLLYNTLQKVVDNQNALLFVTDKDHIEFANKKFIAYFNIANEEILKSKTLSLYTKFNETLNNYDELYALVENKDIHIKIDEDTFILQASLIESTHKLFTLTKVTKLFNEIQMDPLTGIYRKGFLNTFLEKEIKEKKKFALIVLDIDNFKQINDSYGHLIGDQVLREFVMLVKKHIRKNDLFVRWGGEEFILLFEDTDIAGLIQKIEKIRRHVERCHFEKAGHLTASFGITYVQENDTVDSIVNRADKALYQAKANGKNQVVFKA